MANYEDIIDLPHWEPKFHMRMPLRDRAAQFAPFAALTGYQESIDEVGRITDPIRDRSAEEEASLNAILATLAEAGSAGPEVIFTYFIPDDKKAGGAYEAVRGYVRRVDLELRKIELKDGRHLAIDQIYGIEPQDEKERGA